MAFELRRVDTCAPSLLPEMLADCLRELGSPPDYPWLSLYETQPDRHAYLLESAGRVVGFALLRDLESPHEALAEVAEFYVRPEARGRGWGRRGVHALRLRHPQRWQVSVLAQQAGSLAFWRNVLSPDAKESLRATGAGAPSRIDFDVPPTYATDAALGVTGGHVRLANHSPAWAALFAQERRHIEAALGPLVGDIEHVGSTAVPGLRAKPILDIVGAVVDAHVLMDCLPRLEAIGYRHLGWRSAQIGHLLERTGPRGRTHCIHLLPVSSPHLRDYLLVRDHLRSNLAARFEYQVVKHALALEHAHDRRAYTAAKSAEVAKLIAQARARCAILAAAGLRFPTAGASAHSH